MKDVCFSKYTTAVSKKELSKQFYFDLTPTLSKGEGAGTHESSSFYRVLMF